MPMPPQPVGSLLDLLDPGDALFAIPTRGEGGQRMVLGHHGEPGYQPGRSAAVHNCTWRGRPEQLVPGPGRVEEVRPPNAAARGSVFQPSLGTNPLPAQTARR